MPAIAELTSFGDPTGRLSSWVIRSPGSSPAASAGLPGTTFVTTTPPADGKLLPPAEAKLPISAPSQAGAAADEAATGGAELPLSDPRSEETAAYAIPPLTS